MPNMKNKKRIRNKPLEEKVNAKLKNLGKALESMQLPQKPKTQKTAKAQKRILSVTVKRMIDDSPDTSYLGEYSNTRESEFTIDRAHAEDCASLEANHFQTVERLERIIGHLNAWRMEEGDKPESTEWEPLDESIDALVSLQDEAMECNCGGGDMGRGELRYFNGPVENYKGESSEDIREYVRQDYDRMESLNRGDWCFMGMRAEAEVQTGSDVVQRITSGGLWGIESDSGREHLEETQREELAQLKDELAGLGFSRRAIATAFKDVQEKGD